MYSLPSETRSENERPVNSSSTKNAHSDTRSHFKDNRPETLFNKQVQEFANSYSTRQLKKGKVGNNVLQLSRRQKINIARNARLLQETFFDAIRKSVIENKAGKNNDHRARADANGLGILATTIENSYPKEEYVYVGVGSSPDVILELLHLRGAKTILLPVSGVKEATPKNEEERTNAIEFINGQLKDYAYTAVNLLLLDATETNSTLNTITELIKTSDKKQGIDREVKSASITQTKTLAQGVPEKISNSSIDVLEINDHNTRTVIMRERFFQQQYKQLIGRSSPKIPFKDIVAGKNPNVEFNEDDLANIMRFARIVHGQLKLDEVADDENVQIDDDMIAAL